jgi:hypothetical protein
VQEEIISTNSPFETLEVEQPNVEMTIVRRKYVSQFAYPSSTPKFMADP